MQIFHQNKHIIIMPTINIKLWRQFAQNKTLDDNTKYSSILWHDSFYYADFYQMSSSNVVSTSKVEILLTNELIRTFVVLPPDLVGNT